LSPDLPGFSQNGRHRGRDKTVRLMNDITTGDALTAVLNKIGLSVRGLKDGKFFSDEKLL
jgi:hypothetical protein